MTPRHHERGRFLYTAPMMSFARRFGIPVLLFSLAACGLKGPLYLPDEKPQTVPGKVRALPPAPQSQKKDRERASPSTMPSQVQPMPVSPPHPDRPATPPPGQ